MYKRDIFNFLFIISFPVYGLGTYVSAIRSPSMGYLISASVPLVIIAFYCIDLLYQREFRFRLNGNYLLMLFFLLSCIASLFVALRKGLPDANLNMTMMRSLLLLAPFHAFICLTLYNLNNKENLPRLLLTALSALLVFNLVGYYGLGLVNQTHNIEGRLSFPFLDAFYSGAGLVAIINLMLLYYIPKLWPHTLWVFGLVVYFLANLLLFYFINSRLAILIFLFLLFLSMFRLLRAKLLFLFSLFTIPILLSCGLLIYKILQVPALASIVQRVNVEDVITFHGRSYLWEDALDWAIYDQRGLLFGNGYRGQYFLDIIPDVVKMWNAEDASVMHLHSTSLEILVNQGLIIFLIFCFLFYRIYAQYHQKHRLRVEDGSILPVVLFLLFIMQVDTFVYIDGLGFFVFAFLAATVAVDKSIEHREMRKVKPPAFKLDNLQPTELELV